MELVDAFLTDMLFYFIKKYLALEVITVSLFIAHASVYFQVQVCCKEAAHRQFAECQRVRLERGTGIKVNIYTWICNETSAAVVSSSYKSALSSKNAVTTFWITSRYLLLPQNIIWNTDLPTVPHLEGLSQFLGFQKWKRGTVPLSENFSDGKFHCKNIKK